MWNPAQSETASSWDMVGHGQGPSGTNCLFVGHGRAGIVGEHVGVIDVAYDIIQWSGSNILARNPDLQPTHILVDAGSPVFVVGQNIQTGVFTSFFS